MQKSEHVSSTESYVRCWPQYLLLWMMEMTGREDKWGNRKAEMSRLTIEMRKSEHVGYTESYVRQLLQGLLLWMVEKTEKRGQTEEMEKQKYQNLQIESASRPRHMRSTQ